MTGKSLHIALLVAVLGSFTSCTTLFKPEYDVSDIRVRQKRNGYLIELEVNRRIDDIAAFVTPDNWLIITIVGATVDFEHLRSMEPNDLISSVEVIGYKTSVQVTLKLKREFRSCEVVHDNPERGVSIALFSK